MAGRPGMVVLAFGKIEHEQQQLLVQISKYKFINILVLIGLEEKHSKPLGLTSRCVWPAFVSGRVLAIAIKSYNMEEGTCKNKRLTSKKAIAFLE